MEIALEQSLAAAVRYVQEHSEEGTKLYFDEIPEKAYVPSIYFPVPKTTIKKVTFETYLTTISFEAWFMASKNWLSEEAAVNVRNALALDDCKIESPNEDGSLTGKVFRVTDVETRLVYYGITRLSFGIQHYLSKERKSGPNEVHFSIYPAWVRATENLREGGDGNHDGDNPKTE